MRGYVKRVVERSERSEVGEMDKKKKGNGDERVEVMKEIKKSVKELVIEIRRMTEGMSDKRLKEELRGIREMSKRRVEGVERKRSKFLSSL